MLLGVELVDPVFPATLVGGFLYLSLLIEGRLKFRTSDFLSPTLYSPMISILLSLSSSRLLRSFQTFGFEFDGIELQ